MTLTWAAAASFSTVMPVAESSGSIASTLAPLVMSAWASVMNVESEAWPFWMMICELFRPASMNAVLSIGASNSV